MEKRRQAMYSGGNVHCRASYPRIPFIATILPKAAMATADVRKALDEFDRHYIFGYLIAELALPRRCHRQGNRPPSIDLPHPGAAGGYQGRSPWLVRCL